MTVAAPGPRTLFVDHAGVMGGAEFSLLDVVTAIGPSATVLLLGDGPFRTDLERRGVSVSVDALRAFGTVRKRSVLPSPAALVDAFGAARRLAKRATACDVMHANSQKAFVVAAIAGWMARRPVIWHLRDILGAPHFSGANVRAVVWLANRFAAAVIANSRATADAFVAAGGRASLVRVVHNGIDPAPFDAVSSDAARACRDAIGPARPAPLVVHVGRFHHWKGQQVLLRALAIEARAHAWIVGAPLFGEDAFAAELHTLASTLGVGARVKFLGFRADVPTLLGAADIVVHSSVYPEPFGRVVVEGMLAGRPVIAADSGGVREIVTNGVTGVLVPPDDPARLAAAIGRLIDHPDDASAMAARGAAHAREHFSRAAMVEGVRAVIASVARGSG